jgi:hypothetical protein
MVTNVGLGPIRRLNSPAAAPILSVPKHDGPIRLVVDYWSLNKVTIKDHHPLSWMDELRDRLGKNGFHLLRIRKGDEQKTAFRTRYGLYEYMVMLFGLCNAPSTFQAMNNNLLNDLLDEGVIVYIDDILIYTETEEEHIHLVKNVLEHLRKTGLCVSIKKSFFHVKEMEYLGYRISHDGISMSDEKAKAVKNWLTCRNIKEVFGLHWLCQCLSRIC